MNDNYYWIPPDADTPFASMGELLECNKCHRKILVCMAINGTIHHMGTQATCADCLVIPDEFRNKFPDVSQKLEDWKNNVQRLPQHESGDVEVHLQGQ